MGRIPPPPPSEKTYRLTVSGLHALSHAGPRIECRPHPFKIESAHDDQRFTEDRYAQQETRCRRSWRSILVAALVVMLVRSVKAQTPAPPQT